MELSRKKLDRLDRFEVHPDTIKALNDALLSAATAIARPTPPFQTAFKPLPRSLTDGYVEAPGRGRYVGVSKRTKA